MSIWDKIIAREYNNNTPYESSCNIRKRLDELGKMILDNISMDIEFHKIIEVAHIDIWELDRIKKVNELHKAENTKLHDKFIHDLEEEFGTSNNPKKDALFRIAWEKGHAYGYFEVASEYSDMVELIQ